MLSLVVVARRSRLRTSLAVLLGALVLLALVSPAAAKGPASATISGPGIDRPIELVDRSAGIIPEPLIRLMTQTGLWYATGDLPEAIDPPAGDLGQPYTLTWVNSGPPHLSREERTIVQHLYLDGRDGLIIHTPEQDTLADWGPGVVGWFAAPEGLRDTLLELGVPLQEPSSLGQALLAGLVDYWPIGLGVVVLAAALLRRRSRPGVSLASAGNRPVGD